MKGVWRDEHWPDNWTAVTGDGKRSAQFEHTVLLVWVYWFISFHSFWLQKQEWIY